MMMNSEARKRSQAPTDIDAVLRRYANEAERIYADGTAGDNTWLGLLSSLLHDIGAIPAPTEPVGKLEASLPSTEDSPSQSDESSLTGEREALRRRVLGVLDMYQSWHHFVGPAGSMVRELRAALSPTPHEPAWAADLAVRVEKLRRRNPMNGDGFNTAIDMVIARLGDEATLAAQAERVRLDNEYNDRWYPTTPHDGTEGGGDRG